MRSALVRHSQVKQEKSLKTFRKFLWFIFILVVLFFALGIVSSIPKFVINNVVTDGSAVIDDDEIKEKTLVYLGGKNALVYARGNIFLFSKRDIIDFVKDVFPRIYEVHLVEREGQTLKLSIEERDASYLWCGKEAPTISNEFVKNDDCYFIDQKGFIFDEAPFFTNGVYFIVYGGVNSETPIGETVHLENSMENFMGVVNTLSSLGLPAHSLVINKDGQNEILLDIQTTTGEYAKVIFNETESFDILKTKLISSLSEKEFVQDFTLHKDRLEYIDTRFANRVLYRFKEDI
ncbi:MAG: hypothetical protein IT284_01350 [Bacteroidetes bacterium]|nr:hypothetical protein [Bacteroidota bacterium]